MCANSKLKGLGKKTVFSRYRSEFSNSVAPYEPFFDTGVALHKYAQPKLWEEMSSVMAPEKKK